MSKEKVLKVEEMEQVSGGMIWPPLFPNDNPFEPVPDRPKRPSGDPFHPIIK